MTIGNGNGHAAQAPASALVEQTTERPKDVGILGIEMYFPQRVRRVACPLRVLG